MVLRNRQKILEGRSLDFKMLLACLKVSKQYLLRSSCQGLMILRLHMEEKSFN